MASSPETAHPPEAETPVFRATVHGLPFGDRTRHLADLRSGQDLILIPDPPGDVEDVWVHLAEGDPLGHLPREIGHWLAPWMRRGGTASARVIKVGDASVPSWKRLLVEVTCTT